MSPQTSSEPVVYAYTPPASINGEPDIVLKSSEGHLLLAHQSYLVSASEMFKDMIAPDPLDDAKHEGKVPVVDCSEPADVLRTVLALIYPGTRSRPATFEVLAGAFHAAAKYQIECVKDSLRGYLLWEPFLNAHPIAIYSISRGLGFNEETCSAMDTLYHMDVDKLLSEDVRGVPAEDVVAIVRARKARADAIIGGLSERYELGRPYCGDTTGPPIWWERWSMLAQLELAKKPVVSPLFTHEFIQNAKSRLPVCKCTFECRTWSWENVRRAREYLESRYPRTTAPSAKGWF